MGASLSMEGIPAFSSLARRVNEPSGSRKIQRSWGHAGPGSGDSGATVAGTRLPPLRSRRCPSALLCRRRCPPTTNNVVSHNDRLYAIIGRHGRCGLLASAAGTQEAANDRIHGGRDGCTPHGISGDRGTAHGNKETCELQLTLWACRVCSFHS